MREAGLHAEARGHGVDQREFRFRLAIEAVNAAGERVFHLGRGLTDTGEDHLRRVAAGLQYAIQLTAGNDIESRARLRQQRQYGERGIGLHGIADGMRQFAERFIVCAIVRQQRLAGIDIGRRAHAGGEIGERRLLAIKVVLGVGKHRGCRGKLKYGTLWDSDSKNKGSACLRARLIHRPAATERRLSM